MFTPTMRFDSWFKDFLAIYSKDPLLDQVAGKQIIIDAIQDDDQKYDSYDRIIPENTFAGQLPLQRRQKKTKI